MTHKSNLAPTSLNRNASCLFNIPQPWNLVIFLARVFIIQKLDYCVPSIKSAINETKNYTGPQILLKKYIPKLMNLVQQDFSKRRILPSSHHALWSNYIIKRLNLSVTHFKMSPWRQHKGTREK